MNQDRAEKVLDHLNVALAEVIAADEEAVLWRERRPLHYLADLIWDARRYVERLRDLGR